MKKNNAFILMLCLLIGTSLRSFAQDTTVVVSTGPIKTHMFTFGVGYSYLNGTAPLNTFLAPTTPEGFSQNFGILSLQHTTECKRFIYGWTLQAGMSQKVDVANYAGVAGQNMEYSASYGNVLMNFGYAIISTNRVKFYPIIGAGFAGINGNYNRTDDLTAAQFANNPNVSGSVSKYMMSFDGALALDLLMPSKRWSTPNSTKGHVIGLRVGYNQGIGVGNWTYAGAKITDNPGYNPQMFYVKLQFGLFGKKPKEEWAAHYRRK